MTVTASTTAESSERPSKDEDRQLHADSEPWWSKYEDNDIVAMDCEMVTLLPKFSPTKKHFQQAATVDTVNCKLESCFSSDVYHRPYTFICDKYSKAITGFQGRL